MQTLITSHAIEIDIALKIIALSGMLLTAFFGIKTFKLNMRKTKYEYYDYLHKKFLSPENLEKRNNVSSLWLKKRFVTKIDLENQNNKLSGLPSVKDSKLKDYLKKEAGFTFKDIDKDFLDKEKQLVRDTEEILNKCEHISKLYSAGVISKKDIKTFFYTMIADTFIVCLPFILYRRKSKKIYARKMQQLFKIVPHISGDLRRV